MWVWTTLSALAAALINAVLEWRPLGTPGRLKSGRPSLQLEELQPRIAPATFTWQGGVANNDWNTPANYGANNTVLPGPNDDVIFSPTSGASAVLPAGGTTKIAGLEIQPGWNGTINLNGGELDITSLLDFSDPTGTIDGGGGANAGVLRVGNTTQAPTTFAWTGGDLTNAQLIVGLATGATPTANLSWSGGSATNSAFVFQSDSQVTVPAGASIQLNACNLYNAGLTSLSGKLVFSGGVMTNSGELDMNGGGLYHLPLGLVPTFTNGGYVKTVQPTVLPAPGSEVVSTIDLVFDNAGSVESQTGTKLQFWDGSVQQGQLTADAGSIIEFDRTKLAPPGAINELTATNGLNGPGASLNGPGLYDIDDGATLQVDSGANITVQNIRLEQNANPIAPAPAVSTLLLDGNLLAQSFDWRSGTIKKDPTAQGGGLFVLVNSVLIMDDPNGKVGAFPRELDGAQVFNFGNIDWNYAAPGPGQPLVAPGNLNMMNQAAIINDGSFGQGVFVLATGDSIIRDPKDDRTKAPPIIQNIAQGGMLNIGSPGGVGATITGVPVQTQGGFFKVVRPVAVNLQGGYYQSAGTTEVDQGGSVNIAGTFDQDGGAVTDAGAIIIDGDYAENAGTLALQSGTVVVAANIDVGSGASLSGAGTLTTIGDYSGAPGYGGGLEEDAGNVTDQGTITAAGDYLFKGGVLTLVYGTVNAEPVEVDPGALLTGVGTITADLKVAGGAVQVGAGTLAVAGNLNVLTGSVSVPTADLLTVGGAVNQSGGTVDANQGTISVVGAYNENGGLTTLEAGTLDSSGVDVASGGVLSGYGAVNTDVTNAGEVDADNGTLAVSGAYTQTAGVTNVGAYSEEGPVALTVGSFSEQAGDVNIDGPSQGGTATLGVSGAASVSGGTLTAANQGVWSVGGALSLTGGTVALAGGSVVDNNGVPVSSGAVLSGYGTVTGNVTDAGEVDASGANTLTVVGAYTQTGGVTNIDGASTLSVTGALDQQGGVLNLLGASLHVDQGYTVENGATLVAAGTITADFLNDGLLEFAGSGTNGVGFSSDPANGISGNFTQGATGVLDVTIDDYGEPDTLSVAGWATLGGTLNVGLADGYTPEPGDAYFVMHGQGSGGFATVNLPIELNGYFQIEYNEYGMAFMLEFLANQNNGGGGGEMP